MIDTEIEKFTASEAIDAGLIESIKLGEAVISGSYTLTIDGVVDFRQRNFTFLDRHGGLRVGKFVDTGELLNFFGAFCKLKPDVVDNPADKMEGV